MISSAVRRLVKSTGAPADEIRPVDLGHHVLRPPVVGADDDPVGADEVGDRGALAQEFRIGDDGEFGVGPLGADDRLDLVADADRNGRFRDNHGVAVQGSGNRVGDRPNEGQIGAAAVEVVRRADRDEHRIGSCDGASKIGGEAEAVLPGGAGDQLFEAGLEDRHPARFELCDPTGILVDTGDVMPGVG